MKYLMKSRRDYFFRLFQPVNFHRLFLIPYHSLFPNKEMDNPIILMKEAFFNEAVNISI